MEDNFKNYKGTFPQIFLVSVSAIFISVLSAVKSGNNFPGILVYAILFSAFFLILFILTIAVLNFVNSAVKSKYGKGFVYGSVVHGFMLLFPFAVILLISDVILKWNAYQTIVATSIITSASYSTSDLIKLGGSRAGNLILSMVVGVLFMMMFLLCSSQKSILGF
jgi:hypothetical protein